MNASKKPSTPAEMYEAFFVPGMFGPLSKLVLSAARLHPSERVLDVACGTGIVARQAANAVGNSGRVTALDLRPGMLAVAKALPPPNGARIEWHEGDAQALPFENGSFDAVLCQQGLQFFPDREHALREMKRVGKRGARVVVACWREFERQTFFKTLADVELAYLGETGMSLEDAMAPFSLSSADELLRLCSAAGLSEVEIAAETVQASFPSENFVYNMEFSYAAVMPHFVEDPARFEAYVERVEKETAALLAQHAKNGKISFPLETHVVRARV